LSCWLTSLAHGAFNLKHTFSDKAFWRLNGPAPRFAEGTTQNLMDYTNGTELWKYQWDLIHNPETIVLGALDEEEGAMLTMPLLQVNWTSSPPVTEGLFLSPGGMPIGLTGISELALLKSAESGIDARTVLKSVLYGFAKGEQRYFANFSGGRFTGYFLEGTISEKDVYTDTDGTTYNMIQAGRYDVTLLGIDAQAPTTRQVDNNLWYDQPDWNNYTAQGTQITIIDDYTFMPCGSLLREYKDSPLMESHVLKTAILKNPCVLKNPTLHFGGDVPESQWMKEFNMVFGTMLNVAFIPAIVEVGGVVLLEYGKQQLTKASIAAVLDMSLQSVCIYLEGDENMNMADVLYKIDYYQVAVSAGEGAIDNIYTDISVPLYDALMKDGRLKDELTPGDFLKDYALGVTINLLTRGITDGHFSKYYKRMVVAVKKGNLDNKLAKIGLSAENRKAFSDLMGGMTQKSLQRFEELSQKLRTFTVDGTATDLSRFADELDAVADHYPNKSIDELVAAFGCFTAATPVATPSGLRPIADIQTGDTVMSYNHTAQRTEPRVVANLKNYAAKALVILSLSTGQQIEATPTHPFFANGRYTPASQLAPGDTLTAPNGHKVLLQAVQPLDTVATVYNLTVAHNSNYFVGNPGVLVHNDCMAKSLLQFKKLTDAVDKLSAAQKGRFMAFFQGASDDVIRVVENIPDLDKFLLHLTSSDNEGIKGLFDIIKSSKAHADIVVDAWHKAESLGCTLKKKAFPSNSKRPDAYNAAKAFQGKVSGHPDLSFELNGISFDAIVDGKLVDAKFGYGASTFEDVYDDVMDKFVPEAYNEILIKALRSSIDRQLDAIMGTGLKLEWHVSSQKAFDGIEMLFKRWGYDVGLVFVTK
jgi:hypothetical protein